MLTLYGNRGRAFRCRWMLEEAGVPYEVVPVDFATGMTRTLEFLELNANGHIPVLCDGDLVLVESLAINAHIARTYAPSLWPADQLSELIVWTTWAMGELEGPHDAANRSGDDVDQNQLQQALEAIRRPLRKYSWVLGDTFTVVDLNTAAVLLRPRYRPIAETDQTLGDWFKRCTSRPALARAFSRN